MNREKPITRLGSFFAYIRENTTLLIDPGEICAIDECLMLYKGRLHFKQYIKNKRSRFGIKLFCLCPSDPKFRGYTYSFGLYIGKDVYDVRHIPGTEVLSMSERVVVYLMQNLLNEGREVILDNWYLSERLAQFLLSKSTYVTGTVTVRRGVPDELTKLPLEKHQSCFVRKKDILIVRFRDKRDVYVLTTKLTANFQEKEKYDAVKKTKMMYQRPLHIEHYNMHMGAVDAVDQAIEPCNAARKNYSWFKKLGIHIIQRMVLNAKVIYENTNKNKMKFSKFTEKLCDEILEHHHPKYKNLRDAYNSQKKTSFKTSQVHNLIRLPQEDQKRRRCCVCYNNYKTSRQTFTFCSGCDKPLCSKEHFEEYHRK